jgi:hypothetical protein
MNTITLLDFIPFENRVSLQMNSTPPQNPLNSQNPQNLQNSEKTCDCILKDVACQECYYKISAAIGKMHLNRIKRHSGL